MKSKVQEFVFVFGLYCLISLVWKDWPPTGKDIVEMIFIGTLSGLFAALTMEPSKRFIERVVRKIYLKK